MAGHFRITPTEQQQILALLHDGKSIADICRMFRKPRSWLQKTYAQYKRDGRLPPRGAAYQRWTARDTARLKALIDQGLDYDVIAATMGRSRYAIMKRLDHEHYRMLAAPHTMTVKDVSRLMGDTNTYRIAHWIQREWLPARYVNPVWRVRRDDVYAFLQNESYWYTWQPAQITNAGMRTWATEMRKDSVRWVTTHEIATRYAVTRKCVQEWVRKGVLPSVRYGRRYVRETDLDGFVPPCMRGKH